MLFTYNLFDFSRRYILTFFLILNCVTIPFSKTSSGLISPETSQRGFRTFETKSLLPSQNLFPLSPMVSINISFFVKIHDQDQNGQRLLRVRSFWVSYAGLSIGSLLAYLCVSIDLTIYAHAYLTFLRPWSWLQVAERAFRPRRCNGRHHSQLISDLPQTVSPAPRMQNWPSNLLTVSSSVF